MNGEQRTAAANGAVDRFARFLNFSLDGHSHWLIYDDGSRAGICVEIEGGI
jgi:hypothetical protein